MQLTSTPLPIRIITHNIRYANEDPSPNEALWAQRLPKIASTLHFHTLNRAESLICLQEALHHQVHDILASLNAFSSSSTTHASPSHKPEWSYLGVGRDDGKQSGEYSPLIYRSSIWAVQEWKTIWLSETPERPSKGWDGGSVRIATAAIFRHRGGHDGRWKGRRVLAITTHFDNEGVVARREAAKLLRGTASEWARHGTLSSPSLVGTRRRMHLPLFIAGDLNSLPDGEAHSLLNDAKGSAVQDVRELVPPGAVYGDVSTFTGFQGKIHEVLDFVFVGPRADGDGGMRDVQGNAVEVWKAQSLAVLPNVFEDGLVHSDHRAVLVDVELQ